MELYLLNNVLRIPESLHVPSLDAGKSQLEQDAQSPGSSSTVAPRVTYTEADETAVDDARAVLRDRIVRLRRKNARVARSRADLHLQLEKWQSVRPLVDQVTARLSSTIDVEDTENNSSGSGGGGSTLADAVTKVLKDTAQLTAASQQVQGECRCF